MAVSFSLEGAAVFWPCLGEREGPCSGVVGSLEVLEAEEGREGERAILLGEGGACLT